eukprot:2658642-Prymnesium_polylepis.1
MTCRWAVCAGCREEFHSAHRPYRSTLPSWRAYFAHQTFTVSREVAVSAVSEPHASCITYGRVVQPYAKTKIGYRDGSVERPTPAAAQRPSAGAHTTLVSAAHSESV